MSLTDTEKRVKEALPQASVAVAVTLVMPVFNAMPDRLFKPVAVVAPLNE